MAKEAREARVAREEKAAAEAEAQLRAKAVARSFRVRRSAAFKRNVGKFGLPKAKFIANIISKKQKGDFSFTPKDGARGRLFVDRCETTTE